jgi:hypothetical protein
MVGVSPRLHHVPLCMLTSPRTTHLLATTTTPFRGIPRGLFIFLYNHLCKIRMDHNMAALRRARRWAASTRIKSCVMLLVACTLILRMLFANMKSRSTAYGVRSSCVGFPWFERGPSYPTSRVGSVTENAVLQSPVSTAIFSTTAHLSLLLQYERSIEERRSQYSVPCTSLVAELRVVRLEYQLLPGWRSPSHCGSGRMCCGFGYGVLYSLSPAASAMISWQGIRRYESYWLVYDDSAWQEVN